MVYLSSWRQVPSTSFFLLWTWYRTSNILKMFWYMIKSIYICLLLIDFWLFSIHKSAASGGPAATVFVFLMHKACSSKSAYWNRRIAVIVRYAWLAHLVECHALTTGTRFEEANTLMRRPKRHSMITGLQAGMLLWALEQQRNGNLSKKMLTLSPV